jgi:serine/threonine protein kinase
MAPELFSNGLLRFDQRFDIWAMGISLYQMIFNGLPFSKNEINNSIVID